MRIHIGFVNDKSGVISNRNRAAPEPTPSSYLRTPHNVESRLSAVNADKKEAGKPAGNRLTIHDLIVSL
jgi:hypothetical protein